MSHTAVGAIGQKLLAVGNSFLAGMSILILSGTIENGARIVNTILQKWFPMFHSGLGHILISPPRGSQDIVS
jgi:hypothetical protein